MKLKNSYVLLIAMIFLLVSVGSVCAGDVSNDNVIPDDGKDIVTNESTITEPSKKDTEIVTEDNIQVDEKDIKFDLVVKDNESVVIDGITIKNLTITENNKNISFGYVDSQIVIKDKLSLGKHNLLITYLGNNNYTNSSKNIILTVTGDYIIQAPDTVNVNSTKLVEIPINVTNGVDIKVLTPEDLKITLVYKNGNVTKELNITAFTIENNKIVFAYALGRDITTCNLTVTYTANESVKPKKITLNRIYNVKIEEINTKNQFLNGNMTFKLTDLDNPNENLTGLKLTLNIMDGTLKIGNSVTVKENGIATYRTAALQKITTVNGTLSFDRLNVGTHAVELTTSGNVKSTGLKTNLTIEQADIIIKIDDYKEVYGTDKNLTVTVVNANNGEGVPYIIVKLSIPKASSKVFYMQTDAYGKARISAKLLSGGTYNITVSNNDTKNMNYANESGQMVITAKPVVITVVSLTNTYNTGYTAKIKVTDKATGKAVANATLLVKITPKGKQGKYYLVLTDANGYATFLVEAGVGANSLIVQNGDTNYKGSNVAKWFTVYKASGKIVASKTYVYYKQDKYLKIKVVNTKKNNAPMAYAKVNVRIYISSYKYYNYVGKTGGNGEINLDVSNLAPKTYKVVVYNADSKNYTAKSVTTYLVVKKAPTKLTPTALTAKKGTNSYFKIIVKNTKTNKIISGVKVKIKVYTGKTYKTYTATTNSKGIALFNVKSLSVGTHKTVVSSGNRYCVATAVTSSIKITK